MLTGQAVYQQERVPRAGHWSDGRGPGGTATELHGTALPMFLPQSSQVAQATLSQNTLEPDQLAEVREEETGPGADVKEWVERGKL